MEYEWSEIKDERNRAKHKIGFAAVKDFDWSTAFIADRSRHSDGEPRFAGIGPLNGKLHTVVYTWREGRLRIISLRRSNKKEEKAYAQNAEIIRG